jgi:hypothetical protein
MYTYGGMYMDDDSDIKFPLDNVSRPFLFNPARLFLI